MRHVRRLVNDELEKREHRDAIDHGLLTTAAS
jgi:hypothetical protein